MTASAWPLLMRAETAAAYTDERNVRAFLRRVGTVYPAPVKISGRGNVWSKQALDTAIAQIGQRRRGAGQSLADDL